MKIKAEVLKLNYKNKNNRVYDEDVVSSIIDTVNTTKAFIYQDLVEFNELAPKDIIGYVDKAYLENDILFVEGEITDSNQIKELIEAVYIHPSGVGSVTDNGKVFDYTLYAFGLTKESAFDDVISTIKVTED